MNNGKKIKCVILDWAGTTVDFGSMAPLRVFSDIFAQRGLRLETDELRAPGCLSWSISASCSGWSVQRGYSGKSMGVCR